jgi:AraC family transcriptional regulator
MEFITKTLPQKKLIGMRRTMSDSYNTTGELWRSFMPRRKEIRNNISDDLYSLQVYAPAFFSNFSADSHFDKWAAIEVADLDNVPDGMESLNLSGGLYAVFFYKGSSTDASNVFTHIFREWLPNSSYALDDRPHFELLGDKYKNNDPNSEEPIWIPIINKS